jgi:ABC-type lipoprotein release transport system permease subunit
MLREVEHGQRVFSALMAWSTNALSNVEVKGVLAQDRVLAVTGNAYSRNSLSYSVTRRTREIGIRVAVGAQRQNVLWFVLRETLALALFGIAFGIPSALAATRLIAPMLFDLSPSDPSTIAAVSLLLLPVALFAGYLPARRASTIDPIVALRSE